MSPSWSIWRGRQGFQVRGQCVSFSRQTSHPNAKTVRTCQTSTVTSPSITQTVASSCTQGSWSESQPPRPSLETQGRGHCLPLPFAYLWGHARARALGVGGPWHSWPALAWSLTAPTARGRAGNCGSRRSTKHCTSSRAMTCALSRRLLPARHQLLPLPWTRAPASGPRGHACSSQRPGSPAPGEVRGHSRG